MTLRLICLSLLHLLVSGELYALDTGKKCPDFEIQSNNQTSIKLSQYKGKVVYLDFWASWCGPCKKSFPWINNLQTEFGDKDLQVIAVNLDTSHEDAEKFLSKQSSNLQVGFDPEGNVPALYALDTMPSSFLIDREGNLVAAYQGFHETDAEKIRKDIEAQLSEGGK